jgi:uncharacterized membrane protein
MKLLDFLQGKWLGHPLHPAIVHVPVGLWPTATVLDLIVYFGEGNVILARLALYAAAFGLVVALLAVPPGLADWKPIKREKPAWKLAVYHMLLNVGAVLFWGVNLALRLTLEPTTTPISGAILATSLAGTFLVLVGGYLGSLLVFEHGISVARQSKRKWRQIAIRGGAKVPEEK